MTEPPTAARRPTILLVDDDARMRVIVRRHLVREQFDILEADGLEAALTAAAGAAGPVDLLLTDVVMPNGSGAELATRLREQCRGVRVLYMSGYDQASIERFGVQADDDFLQKPFTSAALRDAIERALGGGGP